MVVSSLSSAPPANGCYIWGLLSFCLIWRRWNYRKHEYQHSYTHIFLLAKWFNLSYLCNHPTDPRLYFISAIPMGHDSHKTYRYCWVWVFKTVASAIALSIHWVPILSSTLVSCGAPGRSRTGTVFTPTDFLTTPCCHGRRSVVVWTIPSP